MNLITANYRVVVPAYGRDYKSAKDAKADFAAGKDFIYQNFDGTGATSVRDFAAGVTVNIRYKRMTQVTPFKVPAVKAQPDPAAVSTPVEPQKAVRAPESPVSTPPVESSLTHGLLIQQFHQAPTAAGAVELAIADHQEFTKGKVDSIFVSYLRQAGLEASVHLELLFALHNLIGTLSTDENDYVDAAAYRQTMDRIDAAKSVIETVKIFKV